MAFLSDDEIRDHNFKTIEELQAFLNQKRHKYNSSAREDFVGISPLQMAEFLYRPLHVNSPLKINKVDNAVFDKMPFYQTLETLLKIVHREGMVKLTPKGNLPLKICDEIVANKFWKEELSDLYKQRKEEDFHLVHTAKIIAHIGNLTRKVNNKLNVTKNTAKFLENNDRNGLFMLMFEPFVQKFNWAYHDLYEGHELGQMGWAFSLYLLHQFGNAPHPISFYGAKYLQAFPSLVDNYPPKSYSTPQDSCMRGYTMRTFQRYFNWWGFVQFMDENKKSYPHDLETLIKRTPAFEALFSFNI
jgi:hypothetical protein